MFRIDGPTAVDVMPVPAAVGPHPNYFFGGGSPMGPVFPTIVDMDFLNALQEEVCNLIELTGATLSKTNRTQMRTAIGEIINAGPPGTSGLVAVVYDLDPHLGGDLIVNGHIVSTSNDLHIIPDGTGMVSIDKASFKIKSAIANSSNPFNYFLFGSDTQKWILSSTEILGLDTSGLGIMGGSVKCTGVLDEDSMGSNSPVKSFTQQSGKAYVDTRFNSIPQYMLADIRSVSGSGPGVIGSGWLGYTNQTTLTTRWYAIALPRAGTITKILARHLGNDYAQSMTIEVFKNGVGTGLTATIASLAAAGTASATGSVSMSAGDVLELVFSVSGTVSLKFGEVGVWFV